jgi:hypothetical protein
MRKEENKQPNKQEPVRIQRINEGFNQPFLAYREQLLKLVTTKK